MSNKFKRKMERSKMPHKHPSRMRDPYAYERMMNENKNAGLISKILRRVSGKNAEVKE